MIDDRLKQVLTQVKSTVSIPVIVRMNVPIDSAAQQQLAATGFRIVKLGEISPIIYGSATESIIHSVANLGIVAKVSYDEPVYSAAALPFGVELEEKDIITVTESISSMDVPDVWEQGFTGKGVNIGVIDTGVSQSHPMIEPGLEGVFSAVPGETVEDAHNHGTWCCSAAAGRPVETEHGNLIGAAPEANLFALKALSDTGSGQMSWVMQCMEKAAVDFKCDVLSMSLGSMFDNAGLDPISEMVNDIVTASNTICVVAAGNSFIPMSIGSPGGAVGALTVGSHSLRVPASAPSTFESKGPTTGMLIKPDTSAPGGNIPAPGFAELIMAAGAHGSYQAMAGTCLPGETFITMNHGMLKQIKDVCEGDVVYSLNETTKQLVPSKIIAKLSNGIKETHVMELSDRIIRATDNHPFLVKDGDDFVWKQLSDIQIGDGILCVKKIPDDGTSISLRGFSNNDNEFVKLTEEGSTKLRSVKNYSMGFSELSRDTIYQLAGRQYGTRKHILKKLFRKNNLILESHHYELSTRGKIANGMIPEYTDIDFSRLYGYLLGDGWITDNKRSWMVCVAEKSNSDKNKLYQELFTKVFGLTMKIHKNKDAKYGWYYSYSKRVGDLLHSLGFKESSRTKYLVDWVFELPLDQKSALIDGLIDADGSVRKATTNSTRVTIELANKKLLYQIKQLCHQVGYQCTKIRCRQRVIKAPNSKEASKHTFWSIDIHRNEINNTDYNNCVVRSVKSIQPHTHEEVFDITVENNHNFIAENIVVHNSMATPQVAGIIALLKQANKALTRADMEQLLAMTAFPRVKDTLSGFGPINAMKLLNNLNRPRIPLAQLQGPINNAQSMLFAPLAAIPRPDNERLKAVRLPAFGAS